MELTKIKGNTYYIKAPTNTGVYVFKNKNCILIDTGISNTQARQVDDILTKNNLHPKYIINTHNHIDHCGGNHYFQKNYPGCLVYSSSKERVFMENIELCPAILWGSTPIKDIYKINKPFTVDFTLKYGINKINDEKFEVISLPGHTEEHIGIITPEKVCFLGDAIFSKETLKKYSIPYLYDIDHSLETLEYIKTLDADFFVISHGNEIVPKEEIEDLCNKNIENINKYTDDILELLDQPLSKEDLLQNIAILNNLEMGIFQYYINQSTISAFLSHLISKNLVNHSVEDGKLYFFKKPQ